MFTIEGSGFRVESSELRVQASWQGFGVKPFNSWGVPFEVFGLRRFCPRLHPLPLLP